MRNERKRARAPGTSGKVNLLFTTPPSPSVSSLRYSITPPLRSSTACRAVLSAIVLGTRDEGGRLGEGGRTSLFAETIIR
jgi:hypothetical protein